MSVIEWLNSNAGFVMTILTCVYVMATIWITVESRRTNRLQLKAIEQSASFERARNRPYVIFAIETEMQTYSEHSFELLYFTSVKNIGATSAFNLSISTTPELNVRQGLNSNGNDSYRIPTILSNSLSVLHPGREEREFVAPTHFLFEDNQGSELLFQVTMSYSDMMGEMYSESFEINLASEKDRLHQENFEDKLKHRLITSVEDSAKALNKLVDILDSPDRSNLVFPIDSSEISSRQIELLRRIVESSSDEGAMFLARQFVGGENILCLNQNVQTKIKGLCSDVEILCRAGLLNGYYKNGALQFTVSSTARPLLNSL